MFAAAAIALVGAPPGGTARPGDAARWDDLARLGFELAERDHVLVPDGAAAAPASIAALGLSRWEEAALLARRVRSLTMWARRAACGQDDASAPLLYVVAMSPPDGAGEDERREFHRYYTERHLAEIVEEVGYRRASLFTEARTPTGEQMPTGDERPADHEEFGDRTGTAPRALTEAPPGVTATSPRWRYLAVYEADDTGVLQRQAARVAAMPALTFAAAPAAWSSRRVAWRAAFRRAARPCPAQPAEDLPSRAFIR